MQTKKQTVRLPAQVRPIPLFRDRRRLRAVVAEFPDRNAEFFRLVGQVGGDAGAGKNDDADGQDVQHLVIALERGGFGVAGPVGLEGDLRHLAAVGPAGGDAFGASGAAAV